MKQIFACILCLVFSSVSFSAELPPTPKDLIEKLKTSGDRHVVSGYRLDYVKETDLPYLIGLLDSEEPCAFLDTAENSIHYPGRSTVGHEAAYLVEGFWKRYFPTQLTSQKAETDREAVKRWYRLWQKRKELAQPESKVTKIVGGGDMAEAIRLARKHFNGYLILANRLNPEKEYRLLGAQILFQKSPSTWLVTFKPSSLLPSEKNQVMALGGEAFVTVDLETRKCTLRHGE